VYIHVHMFNTCIYIRIYVYLRFFYLSFIRSSN
jgi:hypothetical protein